MEWSGVEWSGVEWSGVEMEWKWGGVDWTGVGWSEVVEWVGLGNGVVEWGCEVGLWSVM